MLSLQLRDLLLKEVVLVGAPQMLMAMTPLAAAEGSPQEKATESQLSNKWYCESQDIIFRTFFDWLCNLKAKFQIILPIVEKRH